MGDLTDVLVDVVHKHLVYNERERQAEQQKELQRELRRERAKGTADTLIGDI